MKRRISAVLLIFLIVFSTGYPVYSAGTDEGYGEDETSLGQFVDSFENLDNVSVRVLTERNTTLEAMELNFTTNGGPVFENFTSFTEVDEDGDITITDSKIEWTSLRRDANTYVWRDEGAGNIGDFDWEFTLNITDLEAGDASSPLVTGLIFSSNTTGTVWGLDAQPWLTIVLAQNGANDDTFGLGIRERKASANVISAFTGVIYDAGTALYIKFNRTGNDVDLLVYNDTARTILDGTASGTGNGDKYRYLAGISNSGRNLDPADHHTGFIELLTNGSTIDGYATEGYFTTTDYLNFANGAVLVQLTNTTIPGGAGITVEFSEDNSTWVNAIVLIDGFQSIDLRTLNWSDSYYLRYNLTGPGTDTPRLYQSRLITTQGIPIFRNVSGEWIEYQAVSIINLTGVHTVGDLNSTFFIDGDTWNHTEVAGPPGHLIQINFTGVDPDAECLWVTIFYLYTGNVQHDFDIEMWNFTSSTWVDDGHLVDGVAFEWANSTIYAMRIPLDFLRGGEVRVQLNHESPGNVNHVLSIDYIRLIAKIPADVAAVEEFQLFWIVLAIALAMIILVLAKIWFEEGDP